ncbi:MAG: hypothetical protein QG591_443 [Planctomycetota bacterium]|nr:hypothetical protein [Planctomycetota bacterium]
MHVIGIIKGLVKKNKLTFYHLHKGRYYGIY